MLDALAGSDDAACVMRAALVVRGLDGPDVEDVIEAARARLGTGPEASLDDDIVELIRVALVTYRDRLHEERGRRQVSRQPKG